MKLIIYKKPVISAILFNLFTLCIVIYMYIYNYTPFVFFVMTFNGILNGKILINGENMNNKKRIVIIGSLLVMVLFSYFYVYNNIIDKYSKLLFIQL